MRARTLEVGAFRPGSADFLLVSLDPRFDGTLGWPLVSGFDVLIDFPHATVGLLPRGPACPERKSPAGLSPTGAGVSMLTLEPGDIRPISRVEVNGVVLRVLFDTGSPDSSLTEEAARAAGVTPTSAGVEVSGESGGVGPGGLPTWRGTFRSVRIGREALTGVRLPFMRKPNASADMILGADFFRAHRVLISMGDRRIVIEPVSGAGFMRRPPIAGGAAAPSGLSP